MNDLLHFMFMKLKKQGKKYKPPLQKPPRYMKLPASQWPANSIEKKLRRLQRPKSLPRRNKVQVLIGSLTRFLRLRKEGK